MFLLDDRDAVLGGAEPVSVAANGFIEAGLARADAIELEAAQGIKAAQIITLLKGYVARLQILGDSAATDQFQDVPFGKAFEVPTCFEFDLGEIPVAPEWASHEFAIEFGALALIGEQNAI